MPESSSRIPCLIDDVLPTHRVHLLAGVSDAGKTRFVIPAMLDWALGKPVLERPSHPKPWAYVIGDRTQREAADTMNDMGIDIDAIPCIPAFGQDRKTANEILLAAQKMTPQPQLLVWEGFHDAPDGERKKDVQSFLSRMAMNCEDERSFPKGLTILGICESPKLKPAERYPNPRQRVSGVSAWGFHSSTILLIENIENDPSYLQPQRIIWICSKIAIRRQVLATFNEKGRLVATDQPVPNKKRSSSKEPITLTFPLSK